MDQDKEKAKALQGKIHSLVVDINAIARELDEISNSLASEFKGIGAGNSALSLQKAANKYRSVTRELMKI